MATRKNSASPRRRAASAQSLSPGTGPLKLTRPLPVNQYPSLQQGGFENPTVSFASGPRACPVKRPGPVNLAGSWVSVHMARLWVCCRPCSQEWRAGIPGSAWRGIRCHYSHFSVFGHGARAGVLRTGLGIQSVDRYLVGAPCQAELPDRS
jgi:hypothetical protein